MVPATLSRTRCAGRAHADRGTGACTRPGIALPIVLLATVVIGMLVAGAFFSSTQEYHAGRNAVNHGRALIEAENGLALVLAGWDSLLGDTRRDTGRIEHSFTRHDGINIRTVMRRLTPLAYWITSEATVAEGLPVQTARRVGAVIRLDLPNVRLPGALTVHLPEGGGSGELGAGLRANGAETTPANWSDCGVGSPGLAGFVSDDPGSWSSDSSCADGCFAGDPPVLSEGWLADTVAVAVELDAVWGSLLSESTITLPGGTVLGAAGSEIGPVEVDGRCDGSVPSNWGDPGRSTSCAGHFPVILAAGDLHVAGGAGQGVLLVEGDLTLSGGATFVGLVVVRGALRTLAPGPHIIGAVRVAGEEGARSSLAGGGRFEYSRCALMQAVAPHLAPRVESRSWVERYR